MNLIATAVSQLTMMTRAWMRYRVPPRVPVSDNDNDNDECATFVSKAPVANEPQSPDGSAKHPYNDNSNSDNLPLKQASSNINLPPDTPENMLPTPIPDNLKSLTSKQIETIFWQARAHDGCFISVALLQHFFDLLPPRTLIRIRTAKGTEYTTPFYNRFILEMPFIQPNIMCMSVLIPGATYHQGDSFEMTHAVMGFSEHEYTDKITTIVDLSTMQFGESGRGMGGKGLVVIESLEEFYGRVEKVAMGGSEEGDDEVGTESDEAVVWTLWSSGTVESMFKVPEYVVLQQGAPDQCLGIP
ncbi:hypothetical protein ONZ45_g12933 [Pleurotus djamor]|nr:hypothetical protein ONZ45_g12933 [Pleurotus djamor]